MIETLAFTSLSDDELIDIDGGSTKVVAGIAIVGSAVLGIISVVTGSEACAAGAAACGLVAAWCGIIPFI